VSTAPTNPTSATQPASHPAPLLRYAPPETAKARRQPIIVIICGLVSTALTLLALHFVQEHVNTDIMSFSIRFIPFGALIVGLLAALGYSIAAYVLNVRVQGWLIWTILILLGWSYFAAHYVEFAAQGPLVEKATNKQLGFWRYYHLTTIHMTREKNSSRYGPRDPNPTIEEVGDTGYLYRGLGIAGFILGGIGVPLVQRKIPYCPLCQRYMKTKTLLKLPATAKLASFKLGKHKLDTPEHKAAFEHAMNVLQHATTALRTGDIAGLRTDISAHQARVPGKVPVFGVMRLVYCQQCFQGTYTTELVNNGNYQTGLAQQLAKGDLDPSIVQPVVDGSLPLPPPISAETSSMTA